MTREAICDALYIPLPQPEATIMSSNDRSVTFNPLRPGDPPTIATAPAIAPMTADEATKMIAACAVPCGLPAGAPIDDIINKLSDAVEALMGASPEAQAASARRHGLTSLQAKAVATTPGSTAANFAAARKALGWNR